MNFRKRLLLTATVAVASPLTASHAATATKGATAGANWNDTAAGVWSGGSGTNGAPGTGDDVVIDSASILTTAFSGNADWNSIAIGKNALVTFGATTGTNYTLTLGSGGVTMQSGASGSNPGLRFNDAVVIGADQTWDIRDKLVEFTGTNGGSLSDGGTARNLKILGLSPTSRATLKMWTNSGTWHTDSVITLENANLNLHNSSGVFGAGTTPNAGAKIEVAAGSVAALLTSNSATGRTLFNRLDLSGDLATAAGTGTTTGFTFTIAGSTDLKGGTRTLTVGGDATGLNTGKNLNISGVMSNGGLTKMGTGTLVLSNTNTYTGSTTVSEGKLSLTGGGSIASSSIIVGATTTLDVSGVTGGFSLASGQTLSGTGTVTGAMTVSGTLSPGNSPGSMTTGSQTWMDGGDYNFQVLDASGSAGTGHDTIVINGTLDLSNLTTANLAINLWSLSSTGPDVNGIALNFSDALNYSWVLASTTGGVTGFNATDFVINTAANNGTAGFGNSFTGGFAVAVSGNNLVLNYTAVPEPAAALLGGLGLLALLRRRRG